VFHVVSQIDHGHTAGTQLSLDYVTVGQRSLELGDDFMHGFLSFQFSVVSTHTSHACRLMEVGLAERSVCRDAWLACGLERDGVVKDPSGNCYASHR
jgi:hypothetical protein